MRLGQFANAHIRLDFNFAIKFLLAFALLTAGELLGKFIAPVFRENIPGDIAFFHLGIHADFHDGAIADKGKEAGIGKLFQAGQCIGVAALCLGIFGNAEGLQLQRQFVGQPDFIAR